MNESRNQPTARNPAILLLGPTGAGKTPLGDTIEARGLWGMTCLHFDFGANLRAVVAAHRDAESRPPRPRPSPAEDWTGEFSPEEVAFLRDVLESGALLEDEHFPLAERILRAFINRRGAQPGTCIVLNGLPRHAGQARAIERLLDLGAVVVLECPEATVLGRIATNAGGDRRGRVDDEPAAVRRKIELFRKRTKPLVDYYLRQGVRIERLPVGPATTAQEAWQALDARAIGPLRPPDA